MAAEVKIWMQDELLKWSFLGICPNLRYPQINNLLKPVYLVFNRPSVAGAVL